MNKYSYVHIKDVIDIDKFNDEKCEVTLIHEDNVKKAINELPDDELIADLSDMFKIFGDQTRGEDFDGVGKWRVVRVRHCSCDEYEPICN